jgi:hypothetical protein
LDGLPSEAFGKQPRPFVGWLMMVEDAAGVPPSRQGLVAALSGLRGVQGRIVSQTRYDLLCQKLVQEQLYSTAALITSPRTAAETGEFSEMSAMTGLKTFVTALAGHIAGEAARLG